MDKRAIIRRFASRQLVTNSKRTRKTAEAEPARSPTNREINNHFKEKIKVYYTNYSSKFVIKKLFVDDF